MNKLSLYHALPYPLKTLAASLRGRQLEHWRYSSRTDAQVAEIHAREHWTPEQWRVWQQEALARILHRAATRVPYYRDYWAKRRAAGDHSCWERLENWPVLEKEPLREQPRAFLADDCDPGRMFHTHTSGTTGKPLNLWASRESVQSWYAIFEARWRRWNGISRRDPWAIFGGQLVTPVERRKPPFWVWNASMRQLYASSYHLAPDLIAAYVQALRQHSIRYLWGYSSALYTLAQEVVAQKLEAPAMQVVLSNAEPLYPFQRELIAAAFRCPVRETYGMSEMACGAAECDHGALHLWPEAGVVEVLEDGEPVPYGHTGDLVVTSLLNADMPLVRYRVRDRGSLAPPSAVPCPCGRTLPVLQAIEGRIDDVVYTRDGRRVGRLDPVFKADLPVKEVQLVQESLDRIRVVYVPAPGFDAAAARSITERLQQRLGAIDVELHSVDRIPLGANGKFRAVICHVKPEARALAAQS